MSGLSKQSRNEWLKQVVELEARGITDHHEQADELGISYAAHLRRLTNAGLIEPASPRPPRPPKPPRPSVDQWNRLRIFKDHQKGHVARNLGILTQVAAERKAEDEKGLGQAIRWAQDLVDRNLDIDYDYTKGLHTVGALWHDWHLKRLLDEVKRALASRSSAP